MKNRIYVTGDTHGWLGVRKLLTPDFFDMVDWKDFTKDDYIIILGDFGLLWNGSDVEKNILKMLDTMPFTTLFIDGNHENFNMLNSLAVVDWNGGKVHMINDSVIHLMRGQCFNLVGKKFFTMGGGVSQDMHSRTLGLSWWPEELPSRKEYETALNTIEKHNKEFDVILTHSAPADILREINKNFEGDELTTFLQMCVKDEVKYSKWCIGHYHIDREFDDKHMCLYNNITRIV